MFILNEIPAFSPTLKIQNDSGKRYMRAVQSEERMGTIIRTFKPHFIACPTIERAVVVFPDRVFP